MVSVRCLLVTCILAGLVLVAPNTARAGNPAAAEELFRQGLTLMEREQYPEACRKFEASQNEDPSPGTLLNLGACYETLGRTASAWAAYVAAVELARERRRKAQEKDANARAEALVPRLSRLRVDLPPAAIDGLEVLRNDELMAPGSLGIALKIDPGTYTIQARAPGRRAWSTQVEIGAEADSRTVQIPDLPPEESSADASPTPAPATSVPPPAADPMRDRSRKTKTIGYVLGGVGIVAIGVGTVFGLMAASQASNAESRSDLCPDKQCFPKGRNEIELARDNALVSTFGFGVGLAALTAGVVIVLTSDDGSAPRPSARARHRPRLVPAAGSQGGSLSIAGSFQ
jgi:hypothetical protein